MISLTALSYRAEVVPMGFRLELVNGEEQRTAKTLADAAYQAVVVSAGLNGKTVRVVNEETKQAVAFVRYPTTS
jgi:hypothetical protein